MYLRLFLLLLLFPFSLTFGGVIGGGLGVSSLSDVLFQNIGGYTSLAEGLLEVPVLSFTVDNNYEEGFTLNFRTGNVGNDPNGFKGQGDLVGLPDEGAYSPVSSLKLVKVGGVVGVSTWDQSSSLVLTEVETASGTNQISGAQTMPTVNGQFELRATSNAKESLLSGSYGYTIEISYVNNG